MRGNLRARGMLLLSCTHTRTERNPTTILVYSAFLSVVNCLFFVFRKMSYAQEREQTRSCLIMIRMLLGIREVICMRMCMSHTRFAARIVWGGVDAEWFLITSCKSAAIRLALFCSFDVLIFFFANRTIDWLFVMD